MGRLRIKVYYIQVRRRSTVWSLYSEAHNLGLFFTHESPKTGKLWLTSILTPLPWQPKSECKKYVGGRPSHVQRINKIHYLKSATIS